MKRYRFGDKSLNYENQNLFRADFRSSDPPMQIKFAQCFLNLLQAKIKLSDQL